MQPIRTIDLSSGEVGTYRIPTDWERDYLGGASLAARLLYAELTPELNPLSPEAPMLWLNGPLSGTAGPAVGRFVICAKSPLTGIWGESNCGGFWGPELRKAGFDGLWLRGRAEQPVYIFIYNDQVEIRPAGHLWGMDTYATQQAVAAELGVSGASVAVIGPGGEAMLPYALILTDHGRVAGRTGMGAVLGAKNVKAVAVRGTGKVPVLDMAAYLPLRSEANRALRADPMSTVLRELGSAGVAEYMDYLGVMPKKYYHAEVFGHEAMRTTGSYVTQNLLAGVSACHACVIACGRVVRLPDADGQPGPKRKGPEYETLVGFGPNLWLNDPVFATRMGELCDRYGLDTISLSNTLGLAFLLYEQGLITTADTGGVALEWGSAEAAEAMVNLVVCNQGFGQLLAQGARALGRRFGAEDEAVQVNGLETAYHDPRGASGMALVYATSPRGACHNQSDYFIVDIGQADPALGLEFHSRQGGAEKSANVARHQDWRTVFNALVLCMFANIDPDSLSWLIQAACGYEWTVADMLRCGERGWNIKRMINNRLGIGRAQDVLPKAMRTPYPDNPRGAMGFEPEFDAMLAAYYAVRGWDAETGRPTRQKLEELGLLELSMEKESR